jgi:hypothetical protein
MEESIYPRIRFNCLYSGKWKRSVMPRHEVIFVPEVRQKVFELACEGKSKEDIAVLIGCNSGSLGMRCRQELKKGHLMAKANGIQLDYKPSTGSRNEPPTDSQRYQVQAMAAIGLRNEQIATIMNVSLGCLQTVYPDDLCIGRAKGVHKVAGVLYDMATDYEHPNETKFYLKSQAGWKEGTEITFPDEDGKPQKIAGAGVQVNLTAEKMQTIIALLNEEV